MTSNEIRQKFLEFFASKGHKIVPSAPIVIKDDPTLMFTNAGMNQFKDFFLGNKKPDNPRIADTQKCLRVSGKHNDLEEVGVDTYHHTMFEMLGNWSIGDYFKAEAIAWSWELLTEVYKLPKDRLYVSVFEGDPKENLPPSTIALKEWSKVVPQEHIIYGNKKDNFWEMGDTGPCGPCSEIHIDLRPDAERAETPGHLLVNNDHPQVIEIWNNVFIQYNRKADGTLEPLPAMHVDTGMGFERLVRAIQNKTSNYDTDVFTGTIFEVEKITGKKYNFSDTKMDVAFRVLADHIRAISFTIADGQLPANNGAGYVIRRILRRAVRYYYTYLDYKQPLLYQLIDGLSKQFENVFPELYLQKSFVEKVIREEEKSFLKTLEGGLRRIEDIKVQNNTIDGQDVFELYDTYGFPVDLTRLIADEKGWKVDEDGFSKALNEQKERSRADAKRETGDWVMAGSEALTTFVGYDDLIVQGSKAVKYRVLKQKDKELYQLVLDVTPFYPEGGGQVGDTGFMMFDGEVIKVLDTKKENDLIIHIIDRIPDNISGDVYAEVNANKRSLTENNHSATHLLHAALRQVLGTHVQQKGSLVKDDYLRFDMSHYQKITDNELAQVEKIVNEKIRQNIPLEEARALPIEEAKKSGAMMLFGEKYGDSVRMITFDPAYSRELCGGCHVKYTGQLGLFKITSESGIAAGVRRIEAVTANKAEEYVNQQIHELNAIKSFFKNNINTTKNVSDLLDENKELAKEVEKLRGMQASGMKASLISGAKEISGARVVVAKLKEMDTKSAKTLSVNILSEIDNGLVLFGIDDQGKATIMLSIAENLTKSKGWHAGNIIKELSKEINGGGGGQAFFATAGGTDVAGLDKALARLDEFLK
ncbi:MAG TPA: alanine--tRNA ligase [Saprospiraceae bacterium]|nr:alanine--tRNA ligase [Saprospiraceae bacterium]HRG40396.1 alanine--tRNA ligase [Saprospiraceae bacterium]